MLEVLYNDSDCVAVNKPAGLATIPGRAETTSVLEELGAQLGLPSSGTADPRVRVVHRLDKDTSGVLLFAKHTAAQRALSHQFQNNFVQKEYLALVYGKPGAESGEVDGPIGPHPTQKERMHVSKHGRPARTEWRVETAYRQWTLLRVFPKTGKTHQIRVHMKSANLPLAIDPIYNPKPPGEDAALYLSDFKRGYRPTREGIERPLISRLTLHAHRLTVSHPTTGQLMTIEAPLPKDFRATLNQLARHGSR